MTPYPPSWRNGRPRLASLMPERSHRSIRRTPSFSVRTRTSIAAMTHVPGCEKPSINASGVTCRIQRARISGRGEASIPRTLASFLAAPANAAQGFGELGIFRCHGPQRLLLFSFVRLLRLLPGNPCDLLALIAGFAFGPRLDEAALLGRPSGSSGGHCHGK